MSRPSAGSIVVVDWRGGSVPKEPAGVRPAIVIEDDGLFPAGYPNTIVVPLTTDERLAIPAFSLRVDPEQSGGAGVSWALGHHVTTVSLRRIVPTPSRISDGAVARIRACVALAIGLG